MRSRPGLATTFLVMAAVVIMSAGAPSRAGSPDFPMARPTDRTSAVQHIRFDKPTLPPVAYMAFCLRYESECRTTHLFRGGPVALSKSRLAELQAINLTVNRSIVPDRNRRRSRMDPWLINPARGDCNDYAVSKRHELIERGWPARTLLLGEVVTGSGEHHLVLVVRTTDGDLVLDNLTMQIVPWSQASYAWVRIQLPNTRYWATVAEGGV